MTGSVGAAMKRKADPRLLAGRGRYLADWSGGGVLQAAFVRSSHAHAWVRGVDAAAARRLPGVVAVFTVEDGPLPALPLLFPHPALRPVTQVPLAREVCHVGEPVAMVVADSRYRAEDAAGLVRVDYQPLPAVVGMARALEPQAPLAHRDDPDNRAAVIQQRVGEAEQALREAPVVVEVEVAIGRVSCMPLETRGLLASWSFEEGEERLTVVASTQTPHMMQRLYAELLGISKAQVRVKAPDVGGGFGAKEPFYVEDLLVAWAARRLGRPVMWVEDRLEHLQSAVHEREQWHQARMGLTRGGRILAVEDHFLANSGAYVPWGIVVPLITSTLIPGPFVVPHYACRGEVVYTNTVPLAPYRGAGRPQAALVINRLLDRAARALGMDPVEIRRRNFIPPEAFPYDTGLTSREGTPMRIDSGDYGGLLDALLEAGDYAGWRRRQAERRHRRRVLGIGVGVGIENTGMGPHEGATVEIEEDGTVLVTTGAASQGQGHETTLAQVAAAVLGVDVDRVQVREGDTAGIALGTGTFASRTAVVAGSAVRGAAAAVLATAFQAAAAVLEAAPDDLVLEGGQVFVKGVKSRGIGLGQLATLASGPNPGSTFTLPIEPGLSATRYFTPPGAAYSASAQMAVVEVDLETGGIRLLAYAAAHDCGRVINPLVVDGQLVGGVVAGIGTALTEEVRYDPDSGQLLTGSLLDYLLPTAPALPDFARAFRETPSPLNPLGAKGAGEGGTIPAPAAVAAAVEDALAAYGVAVEAVPIRPQALRAALRGQAVG